MQAGCPLWVQTRKSGDAITTSALPPPADIPESGCDVRKVPCVDGSGLARAFFTVLQHWSVQPCVRPFDAVHMTAGHNALRGSGPDQHLAFKNALAHVGCPDRRIDRLCVTRSASARTRTAINLRSARIHHVRTAGTSALHLARDRAVIEH